MKNRNWFWGLFFLLAAVFVIISQIGFFGGIGAMSILATILLAAFFIQSILDRSFFGIFISLAFFYMIYWRPLHFTYISPWLLLLTAVLASTGFSILFGKKYSKASDFCIDAENIQYTSENIDDNNPCAKVSLGSSSKYLHGDCLKSGQFAVSMGALEIYFDQAQLDPDGAELFLDCSLGSIKLYIPRYWQVYDHLHVTLGDVNHNTRLATPAPDSPKLTLEGNVHLANVEIQYI